jgi:hypothetical protein
MSKQGEPSAPNPVQQSSRSDAVAVLKRPASPSFEGLQENTCRKRIKGDTDESTACQSNDELLSITSDNTAITLVEELAQELQCGCCSELVYRPVVVAPCQHFFCGRSAYRPTNLLSELADPLAAVVAYSGSMSVVPP